MLFNIIMWISLLIIFIVSIHNFYLGLKYRNMKYTYRIKNKLLILSKKYKDIEDNKTLEKYLNFKDFISNKVYEILKVEEIDNVKNLKLSIEKSEIDEDKINKLNKEIEMIFELKEKEIITLINCWLDCEKTILKIKKPFWYFINFNIKINYKVLKKILDDRILTYFKKISNTLTFNDKNIDAIFLSYNKLCNRNIYFK